jgi:hypothetical protein
LPDGAFLQNPPAYRSDVSYTVVIVPLARATPFPPMVVAISASVGSQELNDILSRLKRSLHPGQSTTRGCAMFPPTEGSPLTQDQVAGALNIQQFPGATPGFKGWHTGLFEPWAMSYGYSNGMPLYANVMPGNYHIYFLPTRQATIILKRGENPARYGVT